jgi:hypothetical protein
MGPQMPFSILHRASTNRLTPRMQGVLSWSSEDPVFATPSMRIIMLPKHETFCICSKAYRRNASPQYISGKACRMTSIDPLPAKEESPLSDAAAGGLKRKWRVVPRSEKMIGLGLPELGVIIEDSHKSACLDWYLLWQKNKT